MIRDNKFGLHIRGIDKCTGDLNDELEDEHEVALSIKLEIRKELEPNWYVVNSRQDPSVPISHYDRAKLNVFMISGYVDWHFSWRKGNPLYTLLNKQLDSSKSAENNAIVEALRGAKTKIDDDSFEHLEDIIEKIISKSTELGIDISNTSTSVDFKDISIGDDRVCLHDDNIPFRLKGKGSKRLISVAIQMALAEDSGIIIIDNIEEGLEPDRVQHLANVLKKNNKAQIFVATHSRDVLVELDATDIFLVKQGASELIRLDESLQGCIRKNPEAFFSTKIVVCEGTTEIGICRALNSYRMERGHESAAFLGVRFADGTGSNIIDYCGGFNKAGYQVCLFSDSDDDDIDAKKEELKNDGIKVIDCEQGNAIENQVFIDLPWDGIKELIAYQVTRSSEDTIRDSVDYRCTESLTDNWQETDSAAKREALGKTAKENGWFKRIDHGEFLGNIIF